VQAAYHLQRQLRNMAQGLNAYGTVYDSRTPMMEQRMYFTRMTQVIDRALQDLDALGVKFQITSLAQLIKMEPDPRALRIADSFSDAINHAEDVSEIVAAGAVIFQRLDDLNQRIQNALKTNPAYKAWNLSDDDLKFFDWAQQVNQDGKMQQAVQAVIGRSLRRDLTLCPLRRRLNQFNAAQIDFFNAVQQGPPPRQPSAGF